MSRHFSGRIAIPAGCALLCAALLTQPHLAAQGFASGVQLCLHTVLPALFPFFVVCELLAATPPEGRFSARLARLLGLQSPQSASTLFLSWVGGYAVCARMTGRLRQAGAISPREATSLLMLGCCSSPGFVIGCVGGLLLGNLRLGVLLYTTQIAANLLSTAICLPLLPQRKEPVVKSEPPSVTASLPSALSGAVSSCLQVCGCVIFFRMVTVLFSPLLPSCPLAAPIASAVCEISAGCADFASLGGRVALYGCCLCLSLLGVSVWMQLALLLQHTVSLRPLVYSRILHALIFPLLITFCAHSLPGSCAVYRTLSDRVVATGRLPADAAVVTFVFLCAALYKIRQNFYNG